MFPELNHARGRLRAAGGHLLFLFYVASCLSVFCLVTGPRGVSADDRKEEIEQLIRLLGHPDFSVREGAAQALVLRDDAVPYLQTALTSGDKEVARRATILLHDIETRRVAQEVGRFRGLLKDNKPDLAVESMLCRKDWCEDRERIKLLTTYLKGVTMGAAKHFGDAQFPSGRAATLYGDYLEWERAVGPPQFFSGDNPAIPSREEHLAGLIVCGRRVSTKSDRASSLFLASGDTEFSCLSSCVVYSGEGVRADAVINCVVICDGPFSGGSANGSLIIARGPVKFRSSVTNCRIVTTSTVGVMDERLLVRTKLQENDKTLLGLVHFFGTADEGIILKEGMGRATVKEVDKAKRFAKTDLKPGDVIVGVDGTAAESAEQFRRLLRTRVAAPGKPFTLNVLRDGKAIDVPVK